MHTQACTRFSVYTIWSNLLASVRVWFVRSTLCTRLLSSHSVFFLKSIYIPRFRWSFWLNLAAQRMLINDVFFVLSALNADPSLPDCMHKWVFQCACRLVWKKVLSSDAVYIRMWHDFRLSSLMSCSKQSESANLHLSCIWHLPLTSYGGLLEQPTADFATDVSIDLIITAMWSGHVWQETTTGAWRYVISFFMALLLLLFLHCPPLPLCLSTGTWHIKL